MSALGRGSMLRLRPGALLVAGAACLAMLAACGAEDNATVGANEQPIVRDCAQCPALVRIGPGSYIMGSPTTERYRGPNEDQVSVTIRYPFLIGRTPVTVGEFAAFVSTAGYDLGRRKCNGYTSSGYREVFDWISPGFPQKVNHPVTCVSWRDANAYTAWLSKVTGKSYRLPSEAEFEYAARAGTTTPFWFGHYPWPSFISSCCVSISNKLLPFGGHQGTAAVAQFKPNPWGLHDIHGNVWQITEDCYGDKNVGNPADGSPRITVDCSKRAERGGAWRGGWYNTRSANRNRIANEGRANDTGFRVARSLD
jgi:formylglycine-generating enzyme required for sulfatase activity